MSCNYWNDDEWKRLTQRIHDYERVLANLNYELSGELTIAQRVSKSKQQMNVSRQIGDVKRDRTIYERSSRRAGEPHKEDVRAANIARSAKRDRWG